MHFSYTSVVLALATSAAAVSTISAPCGTACPTAAPAAKMITRSHAAPAESSPCPSVIVSAIGAGNGTTFAAGSASGTATGPSATASAFTGAAAMPTAQFGAAAAAVVGFAAILAL